MPTLRIPSVGRLAPAARLTAFIVALGSMMIVGLGIAPNTHAQVPVAPAYDPATDQFLRANRIFEYGRDTKNYQESQHALRTSIPIFQDFINRNPQHQMAQKATYRLGMAQLLTGDLTAADDTFKFVVRKYRTGHYVATAAYRLAAQRYNDQVWLEAAPWFQMAARESEKADLRHKALYYDARCLILGKRPQQAVERLRTIIMDRSNPYRDYARLATGQILASEGKHEEALLQFEALLGPTTAPQERAQALIAAGESAAKLGRTEIAEDYLNQVLGLPALDPQFKSRAQVALMTARFAEKDYAAVLKLMQRGDFGGSDAIQAEVYMLAGRSLAKLGRHHEAPRYFFNVERLAPMSSLGFEASYRRLVSFYQVDNPNLAAQCDGFERIYGEAFPDHEWLHQAKLLKAESLFHQNRITAAAEAYSEVNADQIPEINRASLLFRRGWCLTESGDHNGAAQSLSLFLDKYPDDVHYQEALAQRGKAFLELDNLAAAARDFETLLEAAPPRELAAFAQQHIARVYREQRKYPEMIKRYQALLNDYGTLREDTIAHANYWIGWGWFKLEKWDSAMKHLELARTLVPEYYAAPATTHLILASYSAQNALRLKEEVTRFKTISPEKKLPAKMLTWLGLQLFQESDYPGSDEFLTQASDPDDPSQTDLIVWRHLAKARLRMKHHDRALTAVDLVLELEEKEFWRADAFLDKAHILMGLEKWDEAREAAHQGLALSPRGTVKAGLLMTLGTLAEQRADFDSAAANFLKTAELFVNDSEIKPFALYRAGNALDQAKRTEEAAKVRAQLQREFPAWKPGEE